MSIAEAPRNNSSDVSHARRLEAPGELHLVELQVRTAQTAPGEARCRSLAIASLHGSIFKHGIQLWGYNILSDRVLLVVVPLRPHVIGPALAEVHHRVLPFWDRVYYVCPIADEVVWRVLRYVDVASVPDGGDPLDPHALNSASEHAGLLKHGLLTAPPERLPNPMAWRAFLFSQEDGQFVQALELCLRTGKPFGPMSFVRRVEEACGRSVGSPCLKWPRLFGGCGQTLDPCRFRPMYASAIAS